MHNRFGNLVRRSLEQFRLRFEEQLGNYLACRGSLAEGFGWAWEQALEEVPLNDEEQAQVYSELISLAKNDKLFTRGNSDGLLQRPSAARDER